MYLVVVVVVVVGWRSGFPHVYQAKDNELPDLVFKIV